jgi:hypothetical protein
MPFDYNVFSMTEMPLVDAVGPGLHNPLTGEVGRSRVKSDSVFHSGTKFNF